MANTAHQPGWVTKALEYLGQEEIPGAKTAPFIAKALVYMKAWWTDDETPWCGVAAGGCMKFAGYAPPKAYYRAKAWLDWGKVLHSPVYGCVVIFTRDGGGHVGFVVGIDTKGRLMVLGGNQGNKVSIAPFDFARVAGYRMPVGYSDDLYQQTLPLFRERGVSSSNEA
jgi:uncharacterized protein (TIGR02594 family)